MENVSLAKGSGAKPSLGINKNVVNGKCLGWWWIQYTVV